MSKKTKVLYNTLTCVLTEKRKYKIKGQLAATVSVNIVSPSPSKLQCGSKRKLKINENTFNGI